MHSSELAESTRHDFLHLFHCWLSSLALAGWQIWPKTLNILRSDCSRYICSTGSFRFLDWFRIYILWIARPPGRNYLPSGLCSASRSSPDLESFILLRLAQLLWWRPNYYSTPSLLLFHRRLASSLCLQFTYHSRCIHHASISPREPPLLHLSSRISKSQVHIFKNRHTQRQRHVCQPTRSRSQSGRKLQRSSAKLTRYLQTKQPQLPETIHRGASALVYSWFRVLRYSIRIALIAWKFIPKRDSLRCRWTLRLCTGGSDGINLSRA